MEREKLITKLEMEYDELEKKLTKLIEALNSEGFEEKVGEEQMSLLVEQESAMRLYLGTLARRIDALGNDSKEKSDKSSKPQKEGKQEDKEEQDAKVILDIAIEVQKAIDMLKKYMGEDK